MVCIPEGYGPSDPDRAWLDARSQLMLSLFSWAVVVGLYFVTRRMGGSISATEMDESKTAELKSS